MVHSSKIAINSLAILGKMWFLTAGPVVGRPMILTEFPPMKALRECIQEA